MLLALPGLCSWRQELVVTRQSRQYALGTRNFDVIQEGKWMQDSKISQPNNNLINGPYTVLCLGLVSDHILLTMIYIQLKIGSGICASN